MGQGFFGFVLSLHAPLLTIYNFLESTMRRDTFLKSLAIGAATAGLPLSALAGSNIKMMIPANPGGGWDGTGRALGRALLESKAADTVTYENKGGAAGALGLAQFVNASKGDPNAIMIMGAAMLGGIIPGKPADSLGPAGPGPGPRAEPNPDALNSSN